MAWDPIDSDELNPGFSVLPHMRKAWNCLLWLFGQMGIITSSGIQNSSFEVDSDADNVPDGWVWAAYAGGTKAIDTSTPAHGAKAFKAIHPGGASNGGGSLTSDYIECGASEPTLLSAYLWASAAGMKNQIKVQFFDKAKASISTSTVYDGRHNHTSATIVRGSFVTPSTARYFKVIFSLGDTSVDAAGNAFVDGCKLGYNERFLLTNPTSAYSASTSGSSNDYLNWNDAGSPFTISLGSFGFSATASATLTMPLTAGATDSTNHRLKITTSGGTYYSDLYQGVSALHTFTIKIKPGQGYAIVQPQYQVNTQAGYQNYAFSASSASGSLAIVDSDLN